MGRHVDDERGLVPEDVAGHRREHEAELPVDGWHVDHLDGTGEALVAHVGDHDRHGTVRAVVRDLLGDVVGVRAVEPGRTHQDERFGAEVDVLLVLRDVSGDGAVTELRELDAQLVGRDAVEPVAHDRPVPPARYVPRRDLRDRAALLEHRLHRVGQLLQPAQQFGRLLAIASQLGSECEGEEVSRGDLRVERLRRRHRHLEVAAVRRVEHAVGLVDEVALPAVHDRDHRGTPAAREVDGAVRVGRGAALADRDDEGVRHVVGQSEARELGGRHRVGAQPGADEALQRRGRALRRDRGGALADRDDPRDRAVAHAAPQVVGQRVDTERDRQLAVGFDDPPAERRAERPRRLRELLEQEVRVGAAVDVARRDLGVDRLVGANRQEEPSNAVRRIPSRVARVLHVDVDDLPAGRGRAGRVGRGLAVEPHVPLGLFDQAVWLAGDDVRVLRQSDVQRLTAPAQREEQPVGIRRRLGADRQ